MVDLTSILHTDATLKACDDAFVEKMNAEKPRPYLGASSIGENCNRKLWFRFRWCREVFDAPTLKRFRDGHITEQTVVNQLSLKFPVTDTQWGFNDIDNHFSGHIDGVISGILEAPKTPHVLEVKAVSDKKFNELKKAKAELGEKLAIRKWNPTYHAQIVLYMFYRGLTRSFHVVATAGGRDWMSVRTEADNTFAQTLIEKAKRIIYANDAPASLPIDSFDCRYCGLRDVCREKKLPDRTCRTCVHSTPAGQGLWQCALHKMPMDYNEQLAGCPSHAYLPVFVNGEITSVEENTIVYRMADGSLWRDGK